MQVIYRDPAYINAALPANSTPLGRVTFTQHHPTPPADVAATNAVIGVVAIALPIVLFCAIVAHRKHKATVMQQRIQRLNRLWQLDSSETLS